MEHIISRKVHGPMSSMVLATLVSLKNKRKINYKNMMDEFVNWRIYGEYTPFHEVFDIGNATLQAIERYVNGADPMDSGGTTQWDNGNGSLMRILPVCLYLAEKKVAQKKALDFVHNVSALTHAHLRSKMACGIYYFLVKSILEHRENQPLQMLQDGLGKAFAFYQKEMENGEELKNYHRIWEIAQFAKTPEDEIKSSGYVVDTLEAALWCLLNSTNYKEAVLKAVNLRDDTDTVAAVAGGLAGLIYGADDIPKSWKEAIQKRAWIDQLLT